MEERYLDIGKFWPDNLSISEAYRRTKLDKRTLALAKKGFLEKIQIKTLYQLKLFVSELAGRDVAIEEMIRGND